MPAASGAGHVDGHALTATHTNGTVPARGRPRSRAVDAAILDATLRLLAVDGYQDLTLSAVAEEAGVGRPAIYRRYSTKAQLAAAALLRASAHESGPLPSSTRDALRVLLGATATALASPGALTILGSLLAQERRDPELMTTFREVVFQPRHAVVEEVLARGVAQGEVRPDVDATIAIDLLFGALLARALAGLALTNDWLDRVIDTAWLAIGRSGREAP